jgi:hypothetical protein
MINFILSIVKKNKNQEAKETILKEFFNYSDQKKAITKAARESANDQKILVEKYDRLVRVQ